MRVLSLLVMVVLCVASTAATHHQRVLQPAASDAKEGGNWLQGMNPLTLLREEYYTDSEFTRYKRQYEFAMLALRLAKYGSIQNYTSRLEENAELAEMQQQRKESKAKEKTKDA